MHQIFNVEDIASFNNLVWTELKKYGIKEAGRWRKPTKDPQKKTFFCKPLELLDTEQVLIMIESELENLDGSSRIYSKADILVEVPSFVVQSCQAILKNVQTEGLFRKAGSSCRQREIKRQLERGESIKASHDPIDLANILKQFLRELPEPLIPYQLHDVLLKCIQLDGIDKASQALHLACLLIPQKALATLCYLLQFLDVVASNSSSNLMDTNNLSIVMAPTLMPINISATSRSDKQNCANKLQCSAKVIQMLIENSSRLCGIPRCLSSRLLSISTTSLIDHDRGRCNNRDKRKHRRSSSFNRVFEGLRKIVGVKNELSASAEQLSDRSDVLAEVAPLTSPIIMRTTIKRKVDIDLNLGLSSKKNHSRKALSEVMPQGKVLATTPLTPQGNHRYVINAAETHHSYFASPHIDLNPSPSGPQINVENNRSNIGVLRFFNRKKPLGRAEDLNAVIKTPKLTKRRLSLGKKSTKKPIVQQQRHEVQEPDTSDFHVESLATVELSEIEPKLCKELQISPLEGGKNGNDYEAVHEQYEELKCQVKSLENEIISKHLGEVTPEPVVKRGPEPIVKTVQDQYEKTLEEADKLLLEQSASEQLARHLSRGLRIRRSAEQRVIRSPSARKIGAVRRRSRESPLANNESGGSRRLTRSQSMLAIRRNPSVLVQQMLTPKRLNEPIHPSTEVRISLRRGKPNTIRTGLRDPTPMRAQSMNRGTRNQPPNVDETPRASKPREPETRADDTADDELMLPRRPTRNGSVMKLAENFNTGGQPKPESSLPAPSLETAAMFRTPENNQHQWTSGEVFNRHLDHLRIPLSGRPSVQKIRSENQGKVSAHVRKFDRLASPTLNEARFIGHALPESTAAGVTMTPHRIKSPRQPTIVGRQLSDPLASKKDITPTKVPQVSPLRESQRANALPQSAKLERQDVKIKAPLMTPGQAVTPFGFRVRAADAKSTRATKKLSPLKATAAQLRRSPRYVQTPK